MPKSFIYKYNSKDEVNGLLILKQIRAPNGKSTQKGYEYKCLKDGFIGQIAETKLQQGRGCPCCGGRVVVRGVNDIATTQPWMVKYFEKQEEVFLYSYASNKKTMFKCPSCGHTKEMIIANLFQQGFSCNRCGDKISYPEKFVLSVLCQLNVKIKMQFQPHWSQGKRYDFYLPNENIIIEAHGEQHYRQRRTQRGRSLKEEQTNDLTKEILAIGNLGCKYIQLDCRRSDFSFIKQKILESELATLFNLDEVKWSKCEKFVNTSLVEEASLLWENGKSVSEISELLFIDRQTVREYLKQGSYLGFCGYSTQKSKDKIKKRVRSIDNGKVYESCSQLSSQSEEDFGVMLQICGISRACLTNKPYKGFNFEYVEEE